MARYCERAVRGGDALLGSGGARVIAALYVQRGGGPPAFRDLLLSIARTARREVSRVA
jgi:hypothetical protein